MRLIGSLKAKAEKTRTQEEKKAFIESAGMKLTDEELGKVAGGVGTPQDFADIACDVTNQAGAALKTVLITNKVIK